MEETLQMATDTVTASCTAAGTCAADNTNWSEELMTRWLTFHSGFVSKADSWLDTAAAVDLTRRNVDTISNDVTWSDEWSQFTSFGSWPEWEYYQQIMLDALADGWQGIQSVAYWVWLTVQPVLYSMAYLAVRFLQATLGAFLPYFQWIFIEFCRFHLHLTWRQAVGEAALVCVSIFIWRFVRFLRRKQYLQRTKRFFTRTWQKSKKSIQDTYREIAYVSLLLAMTIPHACYIGLVVLIKACYPSWVTKVSTETMAPSLLKFWYPVAATIVILHHARAFVSDSKGKGALSPVRGKFMEEKEEKRKKKKNRRRRSSLGALLHGTAPGHTEGPGSNEEITYTEEELNEDVTYWLNYWLLYSIMKSTYSLATKTMFIGSFVTSDTMHSILCQTDFLFYIWIFCLPQCLLVLFPSAGEEERRDWSKSKQWCYDCAINPVLTIPSLFLPIIVPCFDKVSNAVSSDNWKKYVVDYVKQPLNMATMLKLLSEERKNTIVDSLEKLNTMVVPAVTLLTPSFITQFGVWYVQFIVPQAHSYRALARQRRQSERILYLKFWVLHAFFSVLINWAHSVFWIVPLETHFTFIVWCVLVMPRVINAIYDEFDRELQAFHILPPVADGLSVENTYTARSLSIIYNSLPKAEDVDKTPDEKKTDDDNNKKVESAAGEKNTTTNNNDNKDVKSAGDAKVASDKKDDVIVADKGGAEANAGTGNADQTKAGVVGDDGEKENQVLSSKSKNKVKKDDNKVPVAAKSTAEVSDSLRRRSSRLSSSASK